MYVVFWCVLALILMTGMCCTGCLLYSKLLCPHTSRGTWAVVWGLGSGEGLEQRVRSLVWLQNCGLLRCTVLLVDGGLDANGRALAVHLAERYPTVNLYSRQTLERRLLEP